VIVRGLKLIEGYVSLVFVKAELRLLSEWGTSRSSVSIQFA
jgi:hypothetical protein